MDSAFKILNRNNLFYNYFLEEKILKVKENLTKEELLERIIFLAKFSWRNHSGYYCDGRLENILLDYGKNLCKYINKEKVEKDTEKKLSDKSGCTILHVATQLLEVGGHTRVLYQFLKRYKDAKQILVLTDQTNSIPKWFIDGIGANITILTLDLGMSLFERSYVLRQISGICKTIILYHHPYDVVPVMAFSHDKGPPVLIENHAHSWFWLGATIADMVIAHTAFHKELTLKTRPVNNVCYLQGIQIDDLVDVFDLQEKAAAKKRLMMSSETICLITIGTSDKFIPNAQYNFYKTAKKILEKFKNVELFVIGIPESAYIRKKYKLTTQRIHFVGVVSDPSEYYVAADICLDALPQPSLGATLYSTLIGMACPLFKYGNGNIFNTRRFMEAKLYDEFIGDMENEEEYLNKLGFLISNPDIIIEIANEIRNQYINTHSNDVFIENIKTMLGNTENLIHQHGKIPDGIYYHDVDNAEIADASPLQDLSSILYYFDNYLSITDKMNIVANLSTKYLYGIDILRLAGAFVKSNVKKLRYVFSEQIPDVLKP